MIKRFLVHATVTDLNTNARWTQLDAYYVEDMNEIVQQIDNLFMCFQDMDGVGWTEKIFQNEFTFYDLDELYCTRNENGEIHEAAYNKKLQSVKSHNGRETVIELVLMIKQDYK